MSYASLARPYARAIFSLAVDTGQLEAWTDRLRLLSDIVGDAGVYTALRSRKISRKAKAKIFCDLLGQDALLAQLATMLIDANRMALIPFIERAFASLLREHQHQEFVTVFTPHQLSHDQVRAITTRLEEKFAKKMLVEQVIEPHLLAGLRIVGEGWRIDANMFRRLEDLTRRLVASS